MPREAWIDEVLKLRKPRDTCKFEAPHLEYYKKSLREHVLGCLQCLRFETTTIGSYCDAYLLWTTDSEAYTYYERRPNETEKQAATHWHGGNVARWKRELEEQRKRNPNLDRRFWEGVAWLRPQIDRPQYVRCQWVCSSFQVVIGRIGQGDGVEELLYHSYAQIE